MRTVPDPVATPATEDGGPTGDAALRQGEVVGKYVVVEKLGEGGMAVVHAGYDPQLDRRVALKVMRSRGAEGVPDRDRRLLREAQGLARLNHPNVVSVHDAGTHDGRVFIAMELVEGKTLTAWLAAKKRTWPRILAVMRSAGTGLAAAHAAGLLHRDFKPDNVMVGDDGRVRVMDFGLVRAEEEIEETITTHRDAFALVDQMTATGHIMGTPAYMSPEQLGGERLSPASDQFAFFVTLWEALYGQRPFLGANATVLYAALLDGSPRIPEHAPRVPTWLRRICERGLATEPGERFPDMNAALHALDRGRARVGRRRAAIAVGIAGALAIAGIALRAHLHARDAAMCEAEGEAIADVWNPDASARVEQALLATKLSFATKTAEHVTAHLDARAMDWQHAATEACLNGTTRDRWSEETVGRARWCLRGHRLDLASLVAELEHADAEVARRAASAAAAPSSPHLCLDPAHLAASTGPPPPGLREAVAALDGELAAASVQLASGAGTAGLDAFESTVERATALGWAPLTARAHEVHAKLLHAHGDLAGSADAERQAYARALAAREWSTAASAALHLIHLEGYGQSRLGRALAWAYHAQLAIEQAGDPMGIRASGLANALGATYNAASRVDEAVEQFERTAELRGSAFGKSHPSYGMALNNLGQTLIDRGDYERAETVLMEGLRVKQDVLGDDHPDVANSLAALAMLYGKRGDNETARKYDARVLEIRSGAYPPDHPIIAKSLRNLAIGADRAGEPEEAARLLQRALEIDEAALGPDHPRIAATLMSIGLVERDLGHLAESETLLKRSLAIQEARRGPNHPAVADVLNNLAIVYNDTGRFDDAVEAHERALEIRQATFGPDHQSVGVSLHNLAGARRAADPDADVRPTLTRALAIYEAEFGRDHTTVAKVLTGLAGLDMDAGDLDAAEAKLLRALEIWDSASSASYEHGDAFLGLARLHGARKRPDEALQAADDALAVYGRTDGVQVREPEARLMRARLLFPHDPQEARAEARRARDGYAEIGNDRGVATVSGWLANHGGNP